MVDHLIALYSQRPSTGSGMDNCIGYLPDALTCNVVEERNGQFDLNMTYPMNGQNYDKIQVGYYLRCKPNMYDNPQLFRIVDIQKKINGEAQITAYHVSYNLINFINGGASLGANKANIATPKWLWDFCAHSGMCPIWPATNYFTFESDISTSQYWAGWNLNSSYMNLRALIGGDSDDSMLAIWPDGEFKFDNYNISFLQSRGQDRGVTIRYGKNLTDINHTINNGDVYDGVFPIWSKEDSSVRLKKVTGDSDTDYAPIIWRDPSGNKEKVFLLDLSDRWDDKPSNDQLKEAGKSWLRNTDYSEVKVQITVSFFNLNDATIVDGAERYGISGDEIAELNKVELCDIVSVYHEQAGIFIKTKVVKTDYNVLSGHYNSIDLGEVAASLATAISGLSGGGSSVINIDTSKTIKDKLYRVSEVKWNSATQFQVTAVSTYNSTDGQEEGQTEPITNVFNISTSGSDVIFTNAANGEKITFKDWTS